MKGNSMFRKLAVALIAATVFTAPALAQSTVPAKTDAAPATNAPVAATTPASPKVVAAKPTLKSAKVKHTTRLAHHRVKHVKYAKHAKKHIKVVKHVKHVKLAKKAKHHTIAHKGATTHMRAASATHPAAMKIKKPVRHTLKTTHRANHVRVTQKSTTPARSDAPAAPKSVN